MAKTLGDLLDDARDRLGRAFGPGEQIGADWLLAALLGTDRPGLLARRALSIEDPELPRDLPARFEAQLQERLTGRPIAHLLGEWEFYGHTLEVTAYVLVPRPETEGIVDQALQGWPESEARTVVDVGTGSGAIAISIALARPAAQVTATDLSPAALAVARRNVERHALTDRVKLIETDLLAGLDGPFDLVVSNPPYVAVDDPDLAPDVAHYEPELALIDPHEGDGLGVYRRLAPEIARVTRPGTPPRTVALLEVGEHQAHDVAAIFAPFGFTATTHRDLAGIERVVSLAR